MSLEELDRRIRDIEPRVRSLEGYANQLRAVVAVLAFLGIVGGGSGYWVYRQLYDLQQQTAGLHDTINSEVEVAKNEIKKAADKEMANINQTLETSLREHLVVKCFEPNLPHEVRMGANCGPSNADGPRLNAVSIDWK